MKWQMIIYLWLGWIMFDRYRNRDTDTSIAVDTLARTVWGEARGEGTQGMQAVANVICNRAANPSWWGSGIVDVCEKPYQFSCWNKTDPNYMKLTTVDTSDAQFCEALRLSRLACAGLLPDITGGATHYHTKSIQPEWASELKQTAMYGSHVFYV